MKIRLDNIGGYLIAFLGGLLVSLILYFAIPKRVVTEEKVLTVRDTIQVDREVIKWKERVRYVTKFDTIIYAIRDTVSDTIRVELPIEHKEYRDTITNDSTRIIMAIDYSGFKPQLDRVWVDYSADRRYAVQSKKKGHFGQFVGVGVQVGYGLGVSVTPKFEPYIGIGISYGFGYSW